jgi:hypothetical protein
MICLFLSTRYAGGVSDTILSNEMKGKNLVSSQLKRVAYAKELAREGHSWFVQALDEPQHHQDWSDEIRYRKNLISSFEKEIAAKMFDLEFAARVKLSLLG